jgi:AI-2 transport protein TqsA
MRSARVPPTPSRYPSAMPNLLAPLDGDRRSMLPGILLLAGIVIVLAGLHGAQGLFATVAFGALAAVICRRLQLGLQARGVGRGWSLTITVVAFVIVIGLLFAAFVASIVALVLELSEQGETLAEELRALVAQFGGVVGLPPDAVPPPIEVGQLLSAARSLLASVTPALTGLFMALLIVTYLLLDADRLRARMRRAIGGSIVGRYDALATELWVYIKVRAGLGAAAAVADTVLLLVLGVPYAVLWGVVSFLFSFVPNIGFILALIPPTILGLLTGGPLTALAVLVGYVVINIAIDYVIQPRFIGASVDLSPVVITVCLLFWGVVLGPSGALLAVPMTIIAAAVADTFPASRPLGRLLGSGPREARAGEAAPSG